MAKKSTKLIGYKGFDENFKCLNYQYKVGETYEEKEANLCHNGFHFCENPFDVLSYYPLVSSHFALIEADGVSDEKSTDSKRASKKITIKTELNLESFIKAGFNFIYESVDCDKAKENTSATSGNRANSATSGYGAHSATSGVDNAIACAIGRKAKAKASLGCCIVLAEWYEGKEFTDARPIAVKSAKVDGKKIKADQWYKLVNKKFVETDDSND